MLISEFARFLGLPALERMNQIQITNAVCELLCEMGTQLVLVDDVHLMDTRSRAGAETSDQLKYLGERIPATFVYSGIDVETSPLLTGVRGSQLAGRFKIVRNQPLRYGSPADKQIWHDLVHGMDSALRLRHHRPGNLPAHAAYLHARTSGRMGSLSHLIREAALVSLLDSSTAPKKNHQETARTDRTRHRRRTTRPETTPPPDARATPALTGGVCINRPSHSPVWPLPGWRYIRIRQERHLPPHHARLSSTTAAGAAYGGGTTGGRYGSRHCRARRTCRTWTGWPTATGSASETSSQHSSRSAEACSRGIGRTARCISTPKPGPAYRCSAACPRTSWDGPCPPGPLRSPSRRTGRGRPDGSASGA